MSVIEEATQWMSQDPDPSTRAELESLIKHGDFAELSDRFSGWLPFGTAGLRGLVGAGPNRMNRVTVIRTTSGLCEWLMLRVPEATSRGICVGRDGRLNSDVFAEDVAAVIAGAGFPVFFFENVVPTPVLGYAVLKTGAAAGVMITASHNPREYNGYKVYWGNGAQIIPPHDQGIADQIAIAPTVPNIARLEPGEAHAEGLRRAVDDLGAEYVNQVSALASGTASSTKEGLVVAYTALHGVGEDVVRAAFDKAGFRNLYTVEEQAKPDGTFPTVEFPNPEEPGAMDLVLELANKHNADIALSNDPDADRLAVAAYHDGDFVTLSGNDVGILLADLCLRRTNATNPLVLNTIVSSPLLGKVADAHGAYWEQTLTGHKWIQNRAMELERDGYHYVFGYEEALGYAATTFVRDKDGISSAVLMADLAAQCKAEGKTLVDLRDDLSDQHGLVVAKQWSVGFLGLKARDDMKHWMGNFRGSPPESVGGMAVLRVVDLKRCDTSIGSTAPYAGLPPSDVLILELDGGHRIMVRPSGTEPKLKFYVYTSVDVPERSMLDSARRTGTRLLNAVYADLKTASESG